MKDTPKPKTPKPSVDEDEPGRARIGLAFEMATHTIAFISHDNIFDVRTNPSTTNHFHLLPNTQVAWKETKDDLPKMYVGVYDDYLKFLEVLVAWIKARANVPGRFTRLARDALRETQDVFLGVGVYTACEILHDAGTSPLDNGVCPRIEHAGLQSCLPS